MLVLPRLCGVKLERKVDCATPLYLPLYRNDGGGGVLLLRVLGDAAECRLGLLLQAQGVAVEDAPGPMPGDGHGLMRGYAGID